MNDQHDAAPESVPRVSILIAVRNEGHHIAKTLEGLCRQDCPPDWLEVLVIDGGSTDNTKAVAEQFRDRLRGLRILDNPKVLSACAWNLGIEHSRSEVISILSGHAELPPNFYSAMIPLLTSAVSGVGGLALPIGVNEKSRVIAAAFSSLLGNGGASFMGSRTRGPVESIAFGCYWRKALKEVGGFDELIVRGQDWDLNLRLRSRGHTLFYEPNVVVKYYMRTSFKALWRRQYLAGLWKRYIHLKSARPFLMRHRIPGLFAAALLIPAVVAVVWPPAVLALLALLMAHAAAVVWQFTKLGLPLSALPTLWWAFLLIHAGYGFGILISRINAPTRS